MKTAIIFGATGQDGSYLAELLLGKGYSVYGMCRRASVDTTQRLRIAMKHENFHLIEGDVTDESSINSIIRANPEVNEVYNLAAQSHVHTSFEQPHYTWKTDAIGVLNILEAIKRWAPSARFYQASTSEMFGNNYSTNCSRCACSKVHFQNEDTPFSPTSPYAISKLAGHYLTKMYRDAYNIFSCSGILFNHESERRGDSFVTRKITRYVGWLKNVRWTTKTYPLKYEEKLHLGNMSASRDWGHAEDYVMAMWLMLQQGRPKDFVIATGESHSVIEFCSLAFKRIGIEDWGNFVVVDSKFVRPSDVSYLCGDATKARKQLKWKPTITFEQLVDRMVDSDIELMKGQPCPTLL